MSKLISIFYSSIVILSMMQFIISGPTVDLAEFVKGLGNQAKATLAFIKDELDQTNSTEVIQTVKTEAIDFFSQSAQVMKLTGIKDAAFPAFIARFVKNLNLPKEHRQNVTEALLNISSSYNNDWEQYKFIYTKESTNSSCYYVSILAQHDRANNKSNLIYSDIKTQMNQTNILVLLKTYKEGSSIEDEVKIVKKPDSIKDMDLELIIKFYDVVAVKAFGKYLGVSTLSNVVEDKNKNNILFLEDA
jgi:hypothetical protein